VRARSASEAHPYAAERELSSADEHACAALKPPSALHCVPCICRGAAGQVLRLGPKSPREGSPFARGEADWSAGILRGMGAREAVEHFRAQVGQDWVLPYGQRQVAATSEAA